MKGFVSYSTHDKFVACEVAKALKTLHIQPFLAHDDLYISQSWRDRILEELSTCHIFVPLLSRDFKQSEWCSMECGYIFSRPDVSIYPLSLDGTFPYGFLAAIQSGIIDITRELVTSRLISTIRAGLLTHHFSLAFATLIEGLERSATTHALRGRILEIEAQLHRFGTEEATRLVCALESRAKLCRSDNRIVVMLQGMYEKLYNHLDEQYERRLFKVFNGGAQNHNRRSRK